MSDKKRDDLLNHGIWIKEQNGVLTMGSLDEDDHSAVILNDSLEKTFIAMGNEIAEALWGESSVKFDISKVNVKKMIDRVLSDIKVNKDDVSVYCSEDMLVSVNYDLLYKVFKGLIKNSLDSDYNNKDSGININISFVDKKLCIIYRDSGGCGSSSSIEREIELIKTRLDGDVKINKAGQRVYLDIMIPEV
ncbi:MAG: hypothetical protein CSB21_01765 [Deltaproteobacteria bacterium]|nr:MAG: hypothetical protein CSB21_01765 [Deltaproteobacteria bacterium]